MTGRGPGWILLFVWILGALPAAGQSLRVDREKGAVEIEAGRVTVKGRGEAVEATGGVRIRWQGYRLEADRVRYEPETDTAEASGRVVLWDPSGNRLECRRLVLRLDTQTGTVEQGRLWIAREGYTVWGERFERLGERDYRVLRGGFTACDGTWPSWRIEADRVDVRLEGFVRARGAAFWVEGAPVAYLPYIVFPVVRERRSGFLVPRFGYSDRQGIRWLLRYYWAPADWWDATVRVEHRSRRGWGEGLEIRYAPAGGHRGRLNVEHFRDRVDRGDRYAVALRHRSRFDARTRLALRVEYEGDTAYRRQLADTLEDRQAQRLESYGLFTRDGEPGTGFVLARYLQALDDVQAERLQILPRAGLAGREVPLAGPLVWEPRADWTRFWRSQGDRGDRVVLDPGVGAGFSLGPVGLAGRAGYRQNLYRVGGETSARGAPRGELSAGASPWRRWGGWIHTVDPAVRLYWEDAPRGGGATPLFDQEDRFGSRLELLGTLETRWVRARDLAGVAGLDLEGGRDLKAGRWLPLRWEAFWTPGRGWRVSADGEADLETGTGSRWSAGVDGRWPGGWRLIGRYRVQAGRSRYLDAGVSVPLGRMARLQYRNRYSFRDRRALEEVYGLSVDHPCWEFLATYSRILRPDEDRDERRYFVTVNLKGLGRLGAWKGVLP